MVRVSSVCLSRVILVDTFSAFKSIIDHMSCSDSSVTEYVSVLGRFSGFRPANGPLIGSFPQHPARNANPDPISVREFTESMLGTPLT